MAGIINRGQWPIPVRINNLLPTNLHELESTCFLANSGLLLAGALLPLPAAAQWGRVRERDTCTCFGATELMSAAIGAMMEASRSPRETISRAASAAMAAPFQRPFERHTSEEIARLERLAARPNPFTR